MAGATPAAWNSAPAKRWRSALEITCTSSFDGIPAARSNFGEGGRSEAHTSELQSQFHLVCRLLLEKKTICVLPCLQVREKRTSFDRTRCLIISAMARVDHRSIESGNCASRHISLSALFRSLSVPTPEVNTCSLHAALPI